jgi:hypothetical protein
MKNILLIAILLTTTVASAEPPVAGSQAVIVAVDGPDIYVDLGAKDGVGAGAELELLHEVVVRDPRSGTMLRDHFSLGMISVVKSGEKVSVARADEDLRKRVLAGDRVKLLSAKKTFVDPWAEQVAASKPGGTEPTPAPAPAPSGKPVNHAELARKAFEETLGKPLDARIQRWLELLREDPRSPYTAAIQREIATLKNQIAVREQALAKARSEHTADRAPRIARLAAMLPAETTDAILAIAPIAKAEPGKPLAMTFLVRDPARVTRAWLYVKPPGAPGFKRMDLAADGDAYLRATLDGDLVRAPGVQWYVEGHAGTETETAAMLGSQAAPNTITVERAVQEAPIEEGRSHIDAHVDYVDFDGGFGRGYDQYYQAEIDFTYRFLKPVYAVRLGFGTLGGMGGPKDVIDEDMTDNCLDESGTYRCKSVSFSYVYTEVEYRIRPNVAIMLRPQAGLLTTDVMASSRNPRRCAGATNVEGCEFLTGFGGRVRVRLGDEASTNLVIGAGFTDGVGTLLEAAYNWRPHPVVPIQLSVNVTDQPVPENFGVRLIGDVGWRKLSWFYPSLRLSYQARDIDHAGFSGGVAMNFDW